jgi:hypothetical protein
VLPPTVKPQQISSAGSVEETTYIKLEEEDSTSLGKLGRVKERVIKNGIVHTTWDVPVNNVEKFGDALFSIGRRLIDREEAPKRSKQTNLEDETQSDISDDGSSVPGSP